MTKPLRIGIAGLGTVGVGTLEVLSAHAEMFAKKVPRPLTVTAVAARDRTRDRGVDFDDYEWFDNAVDMAFCDHVDIVVELIGGSDGIARELTEAALANGKHVVTANKALIATHGTSLANMAEEAGVNLAFEAAVAGGVPIIKALREGLIANRIDRVYGILNGTCNYILSDMEQSGRDFLDVLKEAQALGYAEADPSFDIDGIDAAHKLAILASVAFGTVVDFDGVHVEGIRHISPIDIEFARELGFGIKLLGVAARTADGFEQRVHPCMVPESAPINHVSGVFNGIAVDGNFVDTTIYEGRGAGAGPTASAVVADILDIACGNPVPVFGIPARNLKPAQTVDMGRHRGAYYVRLTVVDEPGVFAEIAAILRDHEVSMESVLQRGRAPGEPVSVVMTLHESLEVDVVNTLDAMASLDTVVEAPRMIRMETFA